MNDDFVIDIRDVAVYKSEILRGADYPDGDTTCTTPSPHGDINGDGSVDILDHDIIAFEHFLSEQKAGCWRTVCDCLNPELDSDNDNVPDCVDLCTDVDDTIFAPQCADAVPTISEWGVLVLAMLLLITGKIYFGRGLLYKPSVQAP